jgi:hypothetical protein
MKFLRLKRTEDFGVDDEADCSDALRPYRAVAPTLLDAELAVDAFSHPPPPASPPPPVSFRHSSAVYPLTPVPSYARSWPSLPHVEDDETWESAGRRRPTSRRLVAVLGLVAAGLMGASLWLSTSSSTPPSAIGRPTERHVDSNTAAIGTPDAPTRACEVPQAEPQIAPAPTLAPAPRRATLAAGSRTSSTSVKRAETETVAPPPALRADVGLEQATRVSEMLREQLSTSVH